MTEKHMFADVSLPFHVWMREGRRWVLRDAASQLAAQASSRAEPPTAENPPPRTRSPRR